MAHSNFSAYLNPTYAKYTVHHYRIRRYEVAIIKIKYIANKMDRYKKRIYFGTYYEMKCMYFPIHLKVRQTKNIESNMISVNGNMHYTISTTQ